MALVSLFGEKLLSKDGEVATATALEGKTVGIYFSAHWCPPCRGFTPKLADFYTKDLKGKGLEIIFVSSDRDEGAFKEYFGEQPWLALPYSDRDKKASLSKKFKVQGIPTFVIIDGEGNVTCKDGRSKVMQDPTGAELPWKPKPWADIIGDSFLKGDATVGKEAIAGKTLGIYFSAHWCPPCRGFTPKLAAKYKSFKEKGIPFEVVFATGDRDESSFKEYFKEMGDNGGDWLAIPFGDKRIGLLDDLNESGGIPCLVIVDENGNVINKNARGAISQDEDGSGFPWAPPAVVDMSQPEGIDESPSILVFVESLAPKAQQDAKDILTKIAKKYIDEAKAAKDDPKYLFFIAKNSEGPIPRIRDMCKLGQAASLDAASVATKGESSPVGLVRTLSNEIGGAHAQIMLMDIPDNGGYYKSDAVEVTEEAITSMISAYEGKKLERLQLEG